MSRVLITGGTGFIGSRLVSRLVDEGSEVEVVAAQGGEGLPRGVVVHTLTLPHPDLSGIVRDGRFDELYHLAGTSYVQASMQDPEGDLWNSVAPTVDLLETLRRKSPHTRMVYTSSAAVYGSPTDLPLAEDAPVKPVSPYGVSKHTCEVYLGLFARLYGLRTASLRPFSVYGPRQRKQVIYDLVDRLHSNPAILEVMGTGEEMRDFVHVDDATAAAMIVMARGPLRGETYNVARGEGVKIRELVAELVAVMQVNPTIVFSGSVRTGDPHSWIADISRLSALGFRPSISLRSGLRSVLEWYRSQENSRPIAPS